jgi:hypothetical protein
MEGDLWMAVSASRAGRHKKFVVKLNGTCRQAVHNLCDEWGPAEHNMLGLALRLYAEKLWLQKSRPAQVRIA